MPRRGPPTFDRRLCTRGALRPTSARARPPGTKDIVGCSTRPPSSLAAGTPRPSSPRPRALPDAPCARTGQRRIQPGRYHATFGTHGAAWLGRRRAGSWRSTPRLSGLAVVTRSRGPAKPAAGEAARGMRKVSSVVRAARLPPSPAKIFSSPAACRAMQRRGRPSRRGRRRPWRLDNAGRSCAPAVADEGDRGGAAAYAVVTPGSGRARERRPAAAAGALTRMHVDGSIRGRTHVCALIPHTMTQGDAHLHSWRA